MTRTKKFDIRFEQDFRQWFDALTYIVHKHQQKLYFLTGERSPPQSVAEVLLEPAHTLPPRKAPVYVPLTRRRSG